jgi:predicted Zn-dependent protease
MQKKFLFIGASLAVLATACSTVPITGRKHVALIPDSYMNSMALQEYQSFLSENKTVTTTANRDVEMVKRVGERISTAVTNYLNQHGQGNLVANYKWEFNLVDSKEVNAWCMPGGKVVVYTGLLPVTQNETALACVMGHEIAHAIAQHGNERMTTQLAAQGIELAGSAVLNKTPQVQNIFLQSFGVGSNLGMLAFSRQDESEADHLGVIFMAMAGYNPQEALPFWQRMAATAGSGGKTPELMSTHPSDERRIADLQKIMPEAMTYYHPAK